MRKFLLFLFANLIVITVISRPALGEVQNPPDVDLPSFGFFFQRPADWFRVSEMSYSEVARLVPIDFKKNSGAAIVEVMPMGGKAMKELAATIATKIGGHVADNVNAASAPPGAIEISLDPKGQFVSRRAVVFPARDQLILFQVSVNDAVLGKSAFDTVLKSFTVKPPTAAVDDLSLRKYPLSLLHSGNLLPLPEPFRPDKVKDPSKEMFLGVHDWPSGHDEASVQVQLVANPNHASIAVVARTTAAMVSKDMKMQPPVAVKQINQNPEAYISTPFSDEKGIQRIVHLRFDEDHIAVLIFRSSTADGKVRNSYMDMAEKAAAGLRFSADYVKGNHDVPAPAASPSAPRGGIAPKVTPPG